MLNSTKTQCVSLSCPPTQELSSDGTNCVPMVCPSGKIISLNGLECVDQSQCVLPNSPMPMPGTTSQKCVSIDTVCPSGQQLDGTHTGCVSKQVCPVGRTVFQWGRPDQLAGYGTTCVSMYNGLVCPPNYFTDASGYGCYNIASLSPLYCGTNPGIILNASGTSCEVGPTHICASGTEYHVETGQCFPECVGDKIYNNDLTGCVDKTQCLAPNIITRLDGTHSFCMDA
jgi:hypothetical protein